MKDMVDGCCVCSDDSGYRHNTLVYCDGCNVAVHQGCYGITDVPHGSWFCQRCETNGKPMKVRCELCPMKNGALKRTENADLWCHVICALYVPEAHFGNNETMEPIVLKDVPMEKYRKSCTVCEQKGFDEKLATTGACIHCNKNGCRQFFHVTCAQHEGMLCEEGNNSEQVKYTAYCLKHMKKLRKDGIKPVPAYKAAATPVSNTSTPSHSPVKPYDPRGFSAVQQNHKSAGCPKAGELPSHTKFHDGSSSRTGSDARSDQAVGSGGSPSSSTSAPSEALSTGGRPNGPMNGPLNDPSREHHHHHGLSAEQKASIERPLTVNVNMVGGGGGGGGASGDTGSLSSAPNTEVSSPGSTALLSAAFVSSMPGTASKADVSAAHAAKDVLKKEHRSDKPPDEPRPDANKPKKRRSAGIGTTTGASDRLDRRPTKKVKSSTGLGAAPTSATPTASRPLGASGAPHPSSGGAAGEGGGRVDVSQTTKPAGLADPSSATSLMASLGGVVSPSAMAAAAAVAASSPFGPPLPSQRFRTASGAAAAVVATGGAAGAGAGASGGDQQTFQSLDELLEYSWSQGSQVVMEQAQARQLDIVDLLRCLYQLREDNSRLEQHISALQLKRDQMLVQNARLSSALSLPPAAAAAAAAAASGAPGTTSAESAAAAATWSAPGNNRLSQGRAASSDAANSTQQQASPAQTSLLYPTVAASLGGGSTGGGGSGATTAVVSSAATAGTAGGGSSRPYGMLTTALPPLLGTGSALDSSGAAALANLPSLGSAALSPMLGVTRASPLQTDLVSFFRPNPLLAASRGGTLTTSANLEASSSLLASQTGYGLQNYLPYFSELEATHQLNLYDQLLRNNQAAAVAAVAGHQQPLRPSLHQQHGLLNAAAAAAAVANGGRGTGVGGAGASTGAAPAVTKGVTIVQQQQQQQQQQPLKTTGGSSLSSGMSVK